MFWPAAGGGDSLRRLRRSEPVLGAAILRLVNSRHERRHHLPSCDANPRIHGGCFGVWRHTSQEALLMVRFLFSDSSGNLRKWLIEVSKLYLFFTKMLLFAVKFRAETARANPKDRMEEWLTLPISMDQNGPKIDTLGPF